MGEREKAPVDDWAEHWAAEIAGHFVDWLGVPAGAHWLDVRCGTGALAAAICTRAAPASVTACDVSARRVERARTRVADARCSFAVTGTGALPRCGGGYDAVVCGPALGVAPDPEGGLREMAARARPGGVVAAYVWDYAGRMEQLRYFWDAAVLEHPDAASLHQARRFPLCRPERLVGLLEEAGLDDVRVRSLSARAEYERFDDYWRSLEDGAGHAASYLASLDPGRRARLQRYLKGILPIRADGRLSLQAAAWAASGGVRS